MLLIYANNVFLESQATDSQHGEPVPPAANGGSPLPEDIANKRITSVEDQINSADVSVSGGSDTEASRAKDGDKGQVRAGASTKKPATFKAVSVNKTFLASKANPNVSSKTSDKPAAGSSTPPTGSATLSISRPRLVAKSGSGTGNSTPRFSSLTNGGKPAAAPDPSVVWNKNRRRSPNTREKDFSFGANSLVQHMLTFLSFPSSYTCPRTKKVDR